ncbi:MAG: CBS domain-containing protein [Peptococcaceae bacterium]|nr:CBS domain-containing protein [Peptococcaceae bacterium]
MRIILSHRYMDFDALASMVAAQKVFPDAVMVTEGEVSASVQDFMALAKEQLTFYRWRDLRPEDIDGVILVDINDFKRTFLSPEAICSLQKLPLSIYDHHPVPEGRRDVRSLPELVRIEPVGASVTLLVERLAELGRGHLLSSFESTLMMLGIYGDTGSLLFDSTTPRDMEAAAFLLRQGAQLSVVAEYLHTPLTPQQLALFQQLLDHGSVEKIQGVPIYISFAESNEFMGGMALLAHRIGEIESADVWFLVVRMENRIHIVARSRHALVAVNRIMEAFGGAGHVKAASATVKMPPQNEENQRGERGQGSGGHRSDPGIGIWHTQVLMETIDRLKAEIAKWVQVPQRARDIMSYPVKTVTSDTEMGEAGQFLLRNSHTGVPVVDAGVLCGIISRRDIDKAVRYGLEHAPVKGYMTRDVITVGPEDSWEEVQRHMVTHDIGRVPVVERGNVVGIITRSDVLRLIYGCSLPITEKLAQDRGMAMRQDVCRWIEALDEPFKTVVFTVSRVARELGLGVYLVGGFVRDLLMKRPTQDVDVVVEGQAEVLARELCGNFPGVRFETYGQFGTARVSWQGDYLFHVDIAGTRSEIYQRPGALPTVEGSTLRDDLFRRDFTINAMAICLNQGRTGHERLVDEDSLADGDSLGDGDGDHMKEDHMKENALMDNRFGELIDYYGGMRDLQQKEIRILHNLSFIDDPLRILRAMRFAGRYGFVLARATREAMETAVREGALRTVSLTRFSEELMLVLPEEEFVAIWTLFQDSGVLEGWFQGAYPWRLGWNVEGGELRAWSPEQRWLALLIDMSDEEMKGVMKRVTLARQWKRDVASYMTVRQKLRDCSGTLEDVDVIMTGCVNDACPGWLGDVIGLDEEMAPLMKAYRQAVACMDMGVTGYDLLRRGVPEGPYIGRLLRQIRGLWLEGRILNREDENAYIESLLSGGLG